MGNGTSMATGSSVSMVRLVSPNPNALFMRENTEPEKNNIKKHSKLFYHKKLDQNIATGKRQDNYYNRILFHLIVDFSGLNSAKMT